MTRTITDAVLVRPVWEARGVRVEGPDEDAFTLAVAALERLTGETRVEPSRLERIDLVGEIPAETEGGLVEALALEGTHLHRHAPGLSSLFEAFVAAAPAGAGSDQPSAVVAVDLAQPSSGDPVPGASAAAAAFLLRSGPGLRPLGHASRHHPPGRPPDASEWVRAAHKCSPETSAETRGTLGVIAEAPPPVLLAEWRSTFPHLAAVVRPWELAEWGHLPSTRGALAVHEHGSIAHPGEHVFLAAIRRDRTEVLALSSDGPVGWVGDWTGGGPGLPTPRDAPFVVPREAIRAVSEGAYVPAARYAENLPSRWRLAADRCSACSEVTFPARGRCRRCGRDDGLATEDLPREDLEVDAVTTVAPGAQPTEFDVQVALTGSYSVALVRLAGSVRGTFQVTDARAGTLRVGDRVDTRLRRLYPMDGSWRYGRKVVPRPGPARR